MALDFPTSPSNGQTYSSGGLTYQYDSTYAVWKILPSVLSVNAAIQSSATAPAGPSIGTLWWNTENGKLFVYNNDGDSSQWVEISSSSVFTQSDLVNTVFTVANSGYTVANASFSAANNVGPQIAPAYNTANAAFGVSNAAFNAANAAAQVKIVSVINANTNAQKNYHYVANSTITLSLPGSPTVGDTVSFTNLSGGTSSIINSNGANVMGTTGNVRVDAVGVSFSLVYAGTSSGWVFL